MQYGAIPTSLIERIALASGKVPIPVLDTLFAMLKARSVMAGVRLGVFEGLAKRAGTAADLAAALGVDTEGLELLLRTLVYCGYVELDGEQFALSALGRRSMITGAPRDLTGYVQWNYTQWEFAEHLENLVRTGQGVDFHHTLTDAAAWGHYQKAMLEIARFHAPVVGRHVRVRKGATRLLDLAGSHGLLGAAICRRHPPLRSTVVDLPAAIEHARALAIGEGLQDLVEHRAGDLTRDDLGTGWDVVLLSNILHHFQPPQIAGILRRVHTALKGGGTAAIWEFERPRRTAAPGQGDGVALFFRLTSTAGAYSGDEYMQWLKEAGFTRVTCVRPRLTPGNVLVRGEGGADAAELRTKN
jgi:2-polyprenyl-3-methyl-5-hydroxy-6-metoxy-1,4-benzoquinol methylase